MTVTCASHMQRRRRRVRGAQGRPTPTARAIALLCERALGETDVDVFGTHLRRARRRQPRSPRPTTNSSACSRSRSTAASSPSCCSRVYPDFQGTGVGSALLAAADEFAAKRGLSFMRVAVTNDDIPQLYFYQRHGFAIYEVAVGEVADRFGSATPGFSGIPVRDEIRLRRAVCALAQHARSTTKGVTA